MKKRILSALLCTALTAACAFAAAPEKVDPPVRELPVMRETPVGEQATVLKMTLKSGVQSEMTVKTDTYDELVLHFADDTLLMDTQTGNGAAESDIKNGDQVYVYYDGSIMESMPPQASLHAVLVNLDKEHAPAHLLTAEAISTSTNSGPTVQTENGGMLVMLPANVEIRPLSTKNIVRLSDIHIGTRFFAWYDTTALSYPGQAVATRVVLPPQTDASFSIVVEGDMALSAGGRMENGVAMAPVRAVGEALGYTVTWNGAQKSVHLTNGTVQTTISIGKDSYFTATAVEGADGMSKPMPLGAAAYETKGVSWVPAALFALMGEPVELKNGTLAVGAVENSQILNAVETQDSAKALADIGLPIDAPTGASIVSYAIIGGNLAQVEFMMDGAAYTYRAAKTKDDISGVYPAPFAGVPDSGLEMTAMPDGGFAGRWMDGEVQHSLVTFDLDYGQDASTKGVFAGVAGMLRK
ncbi:MAG: stalk domain-containing protein [Eubacteriales bacterium]|nr:stalk domain-containing protein [Eubacteriales bacterium]